MSEDRNGVPSDAGVAEARERVRIANQLDRDERLNRGVAENLFRTEIGEADYHGFKQMFDAMPAHERAQVENAVLRDGSLLVHDPAALVALARKSVGDIPTDRAKIEEELAAMRKRMATDKTWHSDTKAGLRYRALLRAREAK